MNTQEYLRLCYKAGLSEEAIDQLLASWVRARRAAPSPRSESPVTPLAAPLSPLPPIPSKTDLAEAPMQSPVEAMSPVLAVAIEEYDLALPTTYKWPDACIYCGDYYTDQDHLLPRNWTGNSQRKVTPTVPACSQCNGILGSKLIPRIHERSAHIVHRLRIKYKKELSIKPWTKKELSVMSYKLQMKIERAEFTRNILRHRVEVLDCGGLPYYSKTPLAHLD